MTLDLERPPVACANRLGVGSIPSTMSNRSRPEDARAQETMKGKDRPRNHAGASVNDLPLIPIALPLCTRMKRLPARPTHLLAAEATPTVSMRSRLLHDCGGRLWARPFKRRSGLSRLARGHRSSRHPPASVRRTHHVPGGGRCRLVGAIHAWRLRDHEWTHRRFDVKRQFREERDVTYNRSNLARDLPKRIGGTRRFSFPARVCAAGNRYSRATHDVRRVAP